MGTQIQMVAHEEVEESFLTQVKAWGNEVLRIEEAPSSPPYLSISIWKTMEEYQDFYQTLLPIEAMISAGFEGAQIFKDQWDKVYGWLSDGERKGLSLLARSIMRVKVEAFQERLEQAAF